MLDARPWAGVRVLGMGRGQLGGPLGVMMRRKVFWGALEAFSHRNDMAGGKAGPRGLWGSRGRGGAQSWTVGSDAGVGT